VYKQVVDKGDADAMCSLGLLYLLNNGIEQSETLGLNYLGQAAENGSEIAKEALRQYKDLSN